jgi:predicted RNase H-like nuclease (RuvC/YqgF family)
MINRNKSFQSLKNQVFRLLIFLLTVTLLLGGRGNAIALPLLPEPLAVIDRATATGGTVVEPVKKKNEVSSPKILEDAQIAYEKAIQATKSAIDDLKAQLAAPSLDKKIIEAQQDNLEDLADNIDDLGEKVSKLTKKLTKSGAKLSETLQNNLITLEKSLVNTSETIDILADDTERLKDSASPFLKTRVEKTIDAVKQTLQESDRAWQELISSATTELEKTSTPK